MDTVIFSRTPITIYQSLRLNSQDTSILIYTTVSTSNFALSELFWGGFYQPSQGKNEIDCCFLLYFSVFIILFLRSIFSLQVVGLGVCRFETSSLNSKRNTLNSLISYQGTQQQLLKTNTYMVESSTTCFIQQLHVSAEVDHHQAINTFKREVKLQCILPHLICVLVVSDEFSKFYNKLQNCIGRWQLISDYYICDLYTVKCSWSLGVSDKCR